MHYYERNIADIKAEYTEFLVHILSPLIYEGIKSMYNKSVEQEQKYIQMSKQNVNVKNPGVFKIFQHFLKNIPTLNQNLIESELIRIRDSSKHADIFEKLIKAVIKSNIILLTYNASGKQCRLVNEKIHEKVDCKIFIHKIYIESARQFYNSPELFWHQANTLDIKKNQRECIDIINKSIMIAIKESIPMNDILSEYLKNDYIIETEEDKFNKVKEMMNNNAEDKINFFDDEDKKVLLTAEENNIDNNIQDNINDIEQLINDKKDVNLDRPNINSDLNKLQEMKEEIKENNTEINEEEYQKKLNNFNTYNSRSNNLPKKSNIPINNVNNDIEKNINQEESRNEDIENINIVKNKLDDRSYFNALFN